MKRQDANPVTTEDRERPVKEWRAREAAAQALHPIMEREGYDMVSAGELVDAVVTTYMRVITEPLPEGWKRYVR